MLKPGDRFERYTIEEPLGQGGMGCVYRAHDTRLGRRVALKVISDHEGSGGAEASARLQREARAAAALDHPNAVSIFDVGAHEGEPYIVMEQVLGHTLRKEVGDTSVPLSTRVAQLADVARALAAAHRRGLVHRDVKPENVMVRDDDGVVKVLDFGIARRAGGAVDPQGTTETPALPTLTVEGVKLGTPVYMSPEQIRGDTLDGRADQFAWGTMAYELCTGRLPWHGAGDMLAVVASILTEPVDRGPLAQAGVPRAVQDVVMRTLEKRPDARFPSMDDVVRALDAAAKGEPAPADPPPVKSVTEEQRFSSGEVRQVLERAVEQQEAARVEGSKLRFDDLLAVGAEMGIDPETLREASRALRARGGGPPAPIPVPPAGELSPADAARRDAWLRRKRRAFHRHAGVYVIVNAALLVFGLVLLSFTPWWIWFIPALGWGIGVAIHGLTALTAHEDDWRAHTEGMAWWLQAQQRRHEERMARGERGRHGRRRVDVPEMPAPVRVEQERLRVADTGRDRRAEEEAALAEEGAREEARRRR